MQKPLDPMSVQRVETPSASYVLKRRYGPARHVIAAASWITALNLLLQPLAALADIFTWDGSDSTDWGTDANWAGGSAPADDFITDIANFNSGTYGGDPVYAPNAGTVSIAGITIGAGNGAMTLSGDNLSIGAYGISIASGAGAVTLSPTTITLGGSDGDGNPIWGTQSWVNNSANLFTVSGDIDPTGGGAGNFMLMVGGTGNTTISGVFGSGGGTGYLYKFAPGTLTLTANSTSDNGVVITVCGGELKLSGSNGAFGGLSTFTLAGSGLLTLDNSGNNNPDRIRDSALAYLQGGTLKFLGNSGVGSSETVGVMTVSTGYASTVDIQAGGTQSATMTFSSYSRSTGGAVNVQYTGAGASLVFTTAPTLVPNTANVGIVNGMFVNGADFATHGGTAGPETITALPAGSYTEMATSGTDTKNSKVTSGKTLTGALQTNSLKIDGGQTVNLSTYTLKLGASSGLAAMILKTSSGDATISAGTGGKLTSVATTTTDLLVRVHEGSLTISAPVDMQGSGRFSKSGPGLLVLSPSAAWANISNGDRVRVQEGAIRLDPTHANYGNATWEVAGGVFELTNDWSPAIGTANKNVRWGGESDGGFAAYGAMRTVTLGTGLWWGYSSHVQDGKALLLNSDTANAKIVMANDIDLTAIGGSGEQSFREIRVVGNANPAAYAEITGAIIDSASYPLTHLLKTGAGRLDLAEGTTHTYTGQTIVQAGTLNVNGTLDSSGGLVTVMTSATLGGTGTINRPVTLESGSTIGSSTTLTVGDDLTLASGTATFSGGTVLVGGTAAIDGTLNGAGGTLLQIAGTGTLGGTGTINCPVTVQSGGTLHPGGSIGKLTVGADISHETGSIFTWQAKHYTTDADIGTAGTHYSQVAMTSGTFTLASGTLGKLYFPAGEDFTGSFWDSNRKWDIITGGNASSSGSIANSDISVYVNNTLYDGGDREITGQGAFSIAYVATGILRLTWTAASGPTGTVIMFK
jgi:autotransporter-associated beta strand protein